MKLNKENITKETFRAALKELGSVLDGKHKDVAKEAGLKYNTYKYYVYDDCADNTDTRLKFWTIYRAALRVIKKNEKQFLTALSHIS